MGAPIRSRMTGRGAFAWAAMVAAFAVSPVRAQTPDQSGGVRGWLFTPSLGYGLNVDDNVLVRGRGDDTQTDLLNAVSPRANLDFLSGRTRFSAGYDGTALLYAQIPGLNYYDQRIAVSARRLVTKKIAIFAQDSLALSPTTELIQLVGTPFVRVGSRVNDARAGLEAALSTRSTFTGAFTSQWVSFADRREQPVVPLRGGQSQGGTFSYRRRISERSTMLADYDLQLASITGDTDRFNVQNGWIGIEQRLSPFVTYSGAVGLSRLGVTSLAAPRSGLAWRVSATRQFQRAALEAGYRRSFVPAYGFGGTVQNQDVTVRLQWTLARRTSAQGSTSWRRNEPLTPGHPSLWSVWYQGSLDHLLTPWLRLNAFYTADRQSIDRPGGLVVRNRFGVQLMTGKPMRLR